MDRDRLVGWCASGAVAVGVGLLAVNVAGLPVGYRTPPGADRPPAARHAGTALSESLLQRDGEGDRVYFARLARDIALRMASGWSYAASRVSMLDNWLLHAAGRVSGTYRTYEFVAPDRALRRGYGACSQLANVAFGELRASGFSPRNVLLPHHAVVAVKDRAGREVIVDATYGVVVPHSLAATRRRPERVVRAYARLRAEDVAPRLITGPRLRRYIASAYADAPIAVNSGRATPQTAVIEPWAYRLKWALPVALLLGGLALWSGLRRKRAAAAARPRR